MPLRNPHSCFVPPYLLRQIATTRPDPAGRWEHILSIDESLRAFRLVNPTSLMPAPAPAAATGPAWVVHTADNGTTLPGEVVRTAGDAATGDLAVDEAATGISGSLALFEEVYGRSSYDDRGATVSLTVHYEQDYANAFWDGAQLVFGDGDGEVFDRFTKPVDVLGHEFTHAVTEKTAALAYQGQSGALNESVSDVFAACLKQRLLGQTALEADWLIGEGLFLPGVDARGLRDMANPGTAYDDPELGKDPQPAHFDDYVETTDDNGGVHLNSGIPNRAFQLAAVAIGGSSWEGAGRIWYAALTGDQVGAQTDFAEFAAATIAAAGQQAAAVEQAWADVGVTPAESSAAPGLPAPGDAEAPQVPGMPDELEEPDEPDEPDQPRGSDESGEPEVPAAVVTRVAVRRTGGFAGRASEAVVDLDAEDGRVGELRVLVERIELSRVPGGDPHPDRFVYDFDLCGSQAVVPEQHLTPDLRRVADLVLRDGSSGPLR